MLNRIRYFQTVVQMGSFSRAAEECNISQSAVSQQVRALERELGFDLLIRRHRVFSLTEAGEYFYRKSLVLVADLDRLCAEAAKVDGTVQKQITLGILRSYAGEEFHRALAAFGARHPDLVIDVRRGSHEELYDLLRTGEADLVLNDQRRAFSSEYVNRVLAAVPASVEISSHSQMAQLPQIDVRDLKNTPCVLVCSPQQQETEREYYRDIIGFADDFLFVPSLEDARMVVAAGRGFLPRDGTPGGEFCAIRCIPLHRAERPVVRNYCAFWKISPSSCFVEEFAELLSEAF